MKAKVLFHEKRVLENTASGQLAIAELRVLEIPKSAHYPQGLKYSLFLVLEGEVIIGMDNHKPKGPHLHLGNKELPYNFVNEAKLLEDFWELAARAGYQV
jgi:hypothetical protein